MNTATKTDVNHTSFQRKSSRGGSQRNNFERGGKNPASRTEFRADCENRERRRLEDPEWVDAAKRVITKRLNVEAQYLNLENLSTDPELLRSSVSMNICSQTDVGAIFKLILSTTCELRALNLAGNNITNLGPIAHFLRSFKNISKLNLENNNIANTVQLKKMWYLRLDELILRNNPLGDLLKGEYVRAVRRLFPSLRRLDDLQLAPEVRFVVEEALSLPDPRMTCCANMGLGQMIGNFVLEYFSYLDAGNVVRLASVYHEESVLTLSANTDRCKGRMPEEYRSNSRNLKFFSPDDERKDLVTFCGRDQIINFLKKLPLSKHSAVTFDLNVDESAYAVFTVSGDVWNIKQDHTFLFVRTYCVVPNPAGGVLILNEQITVSKSPKRQPSQSPNLPPFLQGLSGEQVSMVFDFGKKTGMVIRFSLDCLSGNGWDMGRAFSDFTNLNAANKIPKEAFSQ